MLTEWEYRLNILCFEAFSYFCIIPFKIKGLEVEHPGRKRMVVWSLLLTATALFAAMALWLMLDKVLSTGQDAIPTMTLDYSVIIAAITGIYSAIQNFIRWPDVAQCVWKSVKLCNTQKFERRGGFSGYTYLEIYTMIAPLGVYPATVALAIAYCVIYIWPITEEFHFVVRILLILAETILVIGLTSWLHFGLIIHITFMEKVGYTVKTELKQLRQQFDGNQSQGIQESIQKLKALQVEMNAFNASQQNLIFVYKLATMFSVIFCGFAAIQFFQFDLLLGACNMMVMIEAIFVFGMSYNKGFSIPRSIQSLQRALNYQVRLNGKVQDNEWVVLQRQIKSVKTMAVSVGNFHYLQRVSTPNFVDFCTKNMVRLVMFYRRHSA